MRSKLPGEAAFSEKVAGQSELHILRFVGRNPSCRRPALRRAVVLDDLADHERRA